MIGRIGAMLSFSGHGRREGGCDRRRARHATEARMKILLVYGTTEGHTRKIAAFIADRLSGGGHTVAMADASDVPHPLDIGGFDAILIAASVHVGRYQSSVVRFVNEHRAAIEARPNAFLSVSLAAAGDERQDVQGLKACVARFQSQTGWTPHQVEHVAGAFRYTAYGFFKRWVMKTIAYRKGAPTDTGRDHELTDWEHLARFVDAFVGAIERP
jgi:menaquinone-dependent protoporphyrinogen oxidase